MPVPSSITDLDPVATNNSPQGSETVGPNANDYLQAAFAFIRQLYNGGFVPTADLTANSHKLTNLIAGTANTDAANVAQVKAVYKVGEVKMWHGAVANIASVWGAGWQLADGTNGTADLRDRFIVGAGSSYAANATGGNATNVLTTGQLPAHNHGVSDPGHNHGVSDPGHFHGVSDPGHAHVQTRGDAGSGANWGTGNTNGQGSVATGVASTGISIAANYTGVSIASHVTGITTTNTGSGASIENRPPYYALCLIEYTGIGA